MGKKLLIIKNSSFEGPGTFKDVMEDHAISADVVDVQRNEPIPSVLDYDGILMLGGSASVNDSTLTMRTLLSTALEAIQSNIPYFGVCLGHQLLCKAAGGAVRKLEQPEAGLRDESGQLFTNQITKAGADDPVFGKLPESFTVFQMHGEEAVPPADVSVLATNRRHCAEAIRVGQNAYGVQYHVEIAAEMLAVWHQNDPILSGTDEASLRADFKDVADDMRAVSRLTFEGFLRATGIIESIDVSGVADVTEVSAEN